MFVASCKVVKLLNVDWVNINLFSLNNCTRRGVLSQITEMTH